MLPCHTLSFCGSTVLVQSFIPSYDLLQEILTKIIKMALD